jgi:voltage-gated potassium channel
VKLRATLYRLLAPAGSGDMASLRVDRIIALVVLIDLTLFVIAADMPANVPMRELGLLYQLEVGIVCLFALEYLLRLWSCVEDARYRGPISGRLRYMFTPMALIDLAAALPVLALIPGVQAAIPAALTTVRTFRLLRLFRAIKLVRYAPSLQAFGRALRRITEELLAVLFVVLLTATVGASLAYGFEGEAQPESFRSFGSSLWWSIVTMTTVGYGDTVPITVGGRVVAGVLSVAGIAMFAAPAGLLAAAFGDEMARERRRRERQRDRSAREREERQLEQLIEEAVHEALVAEGLEHAAAERAQSAARRAMASRSADRQRRGDPEAYEDTDSGTQ